MVAPIKCHVCKKETPSRTHITIAPPNTREMFIYKVCDDCARGIFSKIEELEKDE